MCLSVCVCVWELEQCDREPVRVAECFVRNNEGFVIYTDYCTNYPRYLTGCIRTVVSHLVCVCLCVCVWELEQCDREPVRVAECFVRNNEGFVIYHRLLHKLPQVSHWLYTYSILSFSVCLCVCVCLCVGAGAV